jgi:hypothetical protein
MDFPRIRCLNDLRCVRNPVSIRSNKIIEARILLQQVYLD